MVKKVMLALLVFLIFLTFSCEMDSGDESGTGQYNSVSYYSTNSVSGSPPIDGQQYQIGDTITVLGNPYKLRQPGSVLTAWLSTAGIHNFGDQILLTEEILYNSNCLSFEPVWREGYSIEYYGNGNTSGSIPIAIDYVQIAENYTTPDNTGELSKAGFQFAGWSKSPFGYINGELIRPGDEIILDSNARLFAQWEFNDPGIQHYSADNVSFNMTHVPEGIDSLDYFWNDIEEWKHPFWISETEVTYELWWTVRTWAVANGYDLDLGCEGGRVGSNTSGTVPSVNKNNPVTNISWRGAIVWCNALTEWYNANTGSNLEPVYKRNNIIIKSSIGDDGMACDTLLPNTDADGFRLPFKEEWLISARWTDSLQASIQKQQFDNGSYDQWSFNPETILPGFPLFNDNDNPSGSTIAYDDVSLGGSEPAKSSNDTFCVYGNYWNGSSWISTGVESTADVGSLGADSKNTLGLYDMGGNVAEWVFHDNLSSQVYAYGGSWDDRADKLRIYDGRVSRQRDSDDLYTGFRTLCVNIVEASTF
ncbi:MULTISPECIES: SUMF1/EgtB/PvdO family nonheme iron enzyme [unclassified Oceanispirochaeta]|uniref:formylglycine-generating enzyme family protein n=1 Tax=unclassified Oceanispirochaeta TaxID=2635722 RepID=UPI000E093FAB|nr:MULTISPECIES: SUMF1/EgtB/PvdO family nonheme iron enzyme [unclassified Oceanispirochaeta]MBF9017800.1 SUMF1/EgtB/PvdO family nonheme iron enzyme [Oceanispirochaeta sp. M2]NPD74260.1 SUMF1/EgtB/PvdO family nonheme iron enzyme [Oceanispirochaeta sp. M1]RDG29850.1 hypothetical protein DV872_19355 [Oceanispirochaeta sp. M1]